MIKTTLRPLLAGSSALLLCWGPAARAQEQAQDLGLVTTGSPSEIAAQGSGPNNFKSAPPAVPKTVPLSFGFSQSFQVLSNPDFHDPSNGTSEWSITSLDFSSSSVTPAQTLEFSAGAGLGIQRHPDGSVDTSINTPFVNLDYKHSTLSTVLDLNGSYILTTLDQLASPEDFLNDQGQIVLPSNPAALTSTGLEQDVNLGARLELGRDAKVGLVLAVSGEQISYTETTDPALQDQNSANASATGRFSYSEQGDITLGVSAEHQVTLVPGTTGKSTKDIVRDTQNLTLGTNYDISPILTVGGFVQYELVQETGQADTSSPRAQIQVDYSLPDGSLQFQLGDQDSQLTYSKNTPTGSYSVFVSSGLDDSGNGTLNQAGFNLSQAINQVSGVSMGLYYSGDNGSSTGPDVTSSVLVVSYNHQLNKDWDVNVGVNYRLRDPASNTGNTATSSGLFLTISRNVIALR